MKSYALHLPVIVFVIALLGLPFVTYKTFVELQTESALVNAKTFSYTLGNIRDYYSKNVVARVLAHPENVQVRADYDGIDGAIPIPARLSIDISSKLEQGANQKNFKWNFVSEFPFRERPALDVFQKKALTEFQNSQGKLSEYWEVVPGEEGFGQDVRYAVPIIMQQSCVACHNGHADSKKRDWKVGDVRGIQDISMHVQLDTQSPYARYFLAYLAFFIGSVAWLLSTNKRTNANLKLANASLIESKKIQEEQTQKLESNLNQLKKLYSVVEEAPFGITFADAQAGNFPLVYANKMFYQMSGYDEAEVIGVNCKFVQGPQTSIETIRKIRECLKDHQSFNGEILNYKKDGTPYWINLMLFPIYNDKKELIAYAGCQTDLTDLKSMQEDQRHLLSELIEAQKKESLGLTIAGIAHDLNTPIGVANTSCSHMENVIQKLQQAFEQGMIKGAMDESAIAAVQKQMAAVSKTSGLISTNLQKAAQLVKSFKQTSEQASRSEWTMVDMENFLNTLVTSVSPILKKSDCRLTIEGAHGVKMYTDPGAIGQVLTNLIVNSTIHAFEGVKDRQIDIAVHGKDEHVVIEYQDNGVGMSSEVLQKAFTPFFTTKRGSGGSGLGLFSSERIVTQVLGGTLDLDSAVGCGVSFTLRLPIQKAKKKSDPEKE